MALNKLSARQIKNAATGKYEDGGGLRLVVSASGAKKWVLRLTVEGKRREMGLGTYPDVSLATVRENATAFRTLARNGVDPIATRGTRVKEIPTFESCAARYVRAHRRGWKNPKHQRQWVRTLKNYARPKIGQKRVDAITTDDILEILAPIWANKTETAKRVQGRIENILDYAAAHQHREESNPARWRGHLDKLLAKPCRVKQVTHHPAMPYEDAAKFMVELRDLDGIAPIALRFLILTATRTKEVLLAEWDEFDFANETWTIPANRMKSRREHRVPLVPATLQLLEEVPRLTENRYVFPGRIAGKPLSSMALLTTMRRLGFGPKGARGNYVPHGFRSCFRDWSGEVSSYPRDVAEMALAHVIENKVEAAYRRGDLFTKRSQMMQDWAIYLTGNERE
ncbi:integrase arm-type DNA-binding domain-containing protein [Thioalkalivibrio sp. ALM2T]|uniref:tyrosine-type recombinase/integrase n=1 Tax=Thioalkalivibrio sp. ALM2T TaxID=1158184 RepID=UPI00037A1B47|nr:integrase arm-type DNA-binding domain-containing protein [Thioalkalivibrio sp. ALM2T]